MKLKKGICQFGAYILFISLIIQNTLCARESRWRYKHKGSPDTAYYENNTTTPQVTQKEENKKTFSQDQLKHRKLDEEYIKLAKKYNQDNQKEKAIDYYKKALEFNPQHLMATFDLACILYTEGKIEEAIDYYKKTIKIDPRCSQAYFNLSLCYIQTKETDNAIEILTKLLEVRPDYSKAYRQLGVLLQKKDKNEEAILYLKKAAEFNETFDILILIGRSLKKLDNIIESEQYFRKAYEKNPTNMVGALELANTLNMRCNDKHDLEEALGLYRAVLDQDPSLNSVRYNIAYTLKRLDRVPEAIQYYKETLKIAPEYVQARFGLGLAYLVSGNFEQGWPEYEYRWQAYRETPKKYDMPIWDGTNPAGKTILICAEQGLGDTFQFIRYAQVLKRLGATIIFETQKPLTDILKLCPYIDKVIPRGTKAPKCDYQIYVMSLPLIFKTIMDTVPDIIPYLKAKPELIDYWADQLAHDKNFKIGICWQGNRFYRTQALKHAVSAKSISLSLLKPLAEIPGVTLYSLQKKCGEDQLENIDFDTHVFDGDFDDTNGRFMDTAAVIKNLDLVITVDTSISHLAAALGVPVWNMLPKPADWRWLLHTDKTPWYPNMKLFRQKEIGNWEDLVQEVKQELIMLLQKKHAQIKKHTPIEEEQKSAKPSIQKKEPIQDDPIEFFGIKKMVFEETLDELIMLSIKHEKTNNPELLKKIHNLEKVLDHMSSIYKTDTAILDELADKLCTTNRTLLETEALFENLEDKSLLNPEFINLTRKAQYLLTLKRHIKEQIKNAVDPR